VGIRRFVGGAIMSSSCELSPNLGLDLVRATEAAALAAGRWTGLGRLEEAERAATAAMNAVLQGIAIDGTVCLTEEGRTGPVVTFAAGQRLGAGSGADVDFLVAALEGRRLLAGGYPGALSAVAVAPRGAIWAPHGVRYMEKIVVNAEVAPCLAPECLDAPAAWTLALVARAKGKEVRDLVVFVLDRPRHADLVAEIRAAGSHVLLRSGGDLAGALMACLRDGKVDVLMGSGGVSQGMLAACAVKATGGAMVVRLAAQTAEEAAKLRECDPEDLRIHSLDELVAGRCTFFVATGITDSPLLNGVRYHGPRAESNSIILRAETGIRRTILTEHCVGA
jgi:fructose-1,6-bisphosphatase II